MRGLFPTFAVSLHYMRFGIVRQARGSEYPASLGKSSLLGVVEKSGPGNERI